MEILGLLISFLTLVVVSVGLRTWRKQIRGQDTRDRVWDFVDGAFAFEQAIYRAGYVLKTLADHDTALSGPDRRKLCRETAQSLTKSGLAFTRCRQRLELLDLKGLEVVKISQIEALGTELADRLLAVALSGPEVKNEFPVGLREKHRRILKDDIARIKEGTRAYLCPPEPGPLTKVWVRLRNSWRSSWKELVDP